MCPYRWQVYTSTFLFAPSGVYTVTFFSNTEMKYKEPYINALIKEDGIAEGIYRKRSIRNHLLRGRHPSQLDEKDFGKIFEAIYRHFDVAEQMEITLEANPDDMKREYVSLLRNYPFNRVSMGVQSFIRKICVF